MAEDNILGEKIVLKFPKCVEKDTLVFPLRFVPSCICLHNNNLVLGQRSGFTIFSAVPKGSKISSSVTSEFGKRFVYKVNNDYSEICKDENDEIVKLLYTSKYVLALSLKDKLFVVDHINGVDFELPLETVAYSSVDSVDICGDFLVVVCSDGALQIWNLAERQVHYKSKAHLSRWSMAKFYKNNPRQLITLDTRNVVEISDWKLGKVLDTYKLNARLQVEDIIGVDGSIVDQDTKKKYLPPSLDSSVFGHYLKSSNSLDLSTNQKILLPTLFLKSHIIAGQVGDGFIALIAGTHLLIVESRAK